MTEVEEHFMHYAMTTTITNRNFQHRKWFKMASLSGKVAASAVSFIFPEQSSMSVMIVSQVSMPVPVFLNINYPGRTPIRIQ